MGGWGRSGRGGAEVRATAGPALGLLLVVASPVTGPAVAITDFLICLFSNEGTTPSAGTDRITELPRLFGSIGATHPDAGTVRAWRAGCPRSGASRRDTGITCRSRTSIGGCPRSRFASSLQRCDAPGRWHGASVARDFSILYPLYKSAPKCA